MSARSAPRERLDRLLVTRGLAENRTRAQALILAGKMLALLDQRVNVSREDLAEVMLPALRHRIILNFEAQAEGISPDQILRDVAEKCAMGMVR